MVRVDSDAQCNAWMVLHAMVQHMMYRSNPLWYAQVHGMEHVHGMGIGGWWCYAHVVIDRHSRHGTVRSCMTLHSAYIQVHSGPFGRAPR